MGSAAGTSSSAASDLQQVPVAQHAGELATARQACDEAKADCADLQNTVQRLRSGSASAASGVPVSVAYEQLTHCSKSQSTT